MTHLGFNNNHSLTNLERKWP